jgi:hypothetical protein
MHHNYKRVIKKFTAALCLRVAIWLCLLGKRAERVFSL